MEKYDVIIIGGGAAGLASAVLSSKKGLKTLVLEKSDRVGKKLLLTGNGLGNICNKNISNTNFHSENEVKKNSYLRKFSLNDALAFFDFLNLPITSIGNKIYPLSLQSSSVLDALRIKCNTLNVITKTDFGVTNIEPLGDCIKVYGETEFFIGSKVIVATGGSAYPRLYSDGNGYNLFLTYAHKLIKPFPTLVQLKCEGVSSMNLKGIKTDVITTLFVNGTPIKSESGELLFTDYGVSGPVIFNLSGEASRSLGNSQSVDLKINLSPELEPYGELIKRRSKMGEAPLSELFNGYLKKQFTRTVFSKSSIPFLNRTVSSLSDEEIKALSKTISSFDLKVTSSLGFDSAQATIGGLSLDDFDDNLMSLKIKNVYAAGEILDVDGDCGGFNLFWAWASANIIVNSF